MADEVAKIKSYVSLTDRDDKGIAISLRSSKFIPGASKMTNLEQEEVFLNSVFTPNEYLTGRRFFIPSITDINKSNAARFENFQA